ncbi:hypothetical protein AAFF_G00088300 [Aldrovandia affinis]|uniref:Uncharacterized protein n=1 Tax=Aldrovandia affinis TaxID=143900 RepID=A0AAD7RW93_9TELE|nr:hypothetical protein AAFF_G00088300 [Aldrovandia affinis]
MLVIPRWALIYTLGPTHSYTQSLLLAAHVSAGCTFLCSLCGQLQAGRSLTGHAAPVSGAVMRQPGVRLGASCEGWACVMDSSRGPSPENRFIVSSYPRAFKALNSSGRIVFYSFGT